ncbi:MAG: homoserine dehydrogenase [Chloroflexi bacterium]|nr:homoserine dehydrogenase [Chloroflexota bacterium]
MKLTLIGFGVVGQGLVAILTDKAAELRRQHNFAPQIVAVATRSRGSLLHPDGLDPQGLLTAIAAGHLDHYPDAAGLSRGLDPLQIIAQSGAAVLIEAAPSNLQTGQPALDHVRAAFAAGQHVVLANKGPVAVAYHDLVARARAAGRSLLFEATVMAGTPALRTATAGLAGCQIAEVSGVLNGTTNYMLTEMERGLTYADALAQAQQLGYAETDPSADVDGWDAAAKAVILGAALFDQALDLRALPVQGIRHLTPADIAAARAAGERWKLIARITPQAAAVAPARLPLDHPLAAVGGATNAITYTTDLLGAVTLIGPGAGQRVTGAALLADLLAVHQRVSHRSIS